MDSHSKSSKGVLRLLIYDRTRLRSQAFISSNMMHLGIQGDWNSPRAAGS